MAEPESENPNPDEVEREMRSAIERIRAKLAEPDTWRKSEDPPAGERADKLP
jgi:hypothetical protein